MLIPVQDASALAIRVLERAGVPGDHAAIQAEILIEAELRGLASHGLLRLKRIVERIANRVITPDAPGLHHWRSDAVLDVDGQMGLGPVVAAKALEKLQERAATTGVAMAAISNSNHLGMLGWYAEKAARAGLIAIVLSTSEALVHPWAGRRAMIGTNPIAIGVPAVPYPFVLDMATSVVSMGKIHDHANRGEPIPADWALDADGSPTTDPQAAKSGAIAPFGGAKGYALGLAFEVLVSSLTAVAIGTAVKGTLDSDAICNKGDLLLVMKPYGSTVVDTISAYLDSIRDCPPIDGDISVLVPGDRANRSRDRMLAQGLPVRDEIWQQMLDLAE